MTNYSRFLWLYDQLTEREMTPQQIAVLFVLIAREEAGMPAVTKYELGALVGVTERYVATILSELQKELQLILATKGEKKGRGRAPNKYIIRADSNGAPIPDDWIVNCKSGTTVPEQKRKTDATAALSVENPSPNSGTGEPVICGEVLPPMKEHAGARVENNLLTKNNLELNPETLSVCDAGAHEMPEFAGELDMAWSLSAKHRAFANERGYLNGSCDELFGQFLDHTATKGPRISTAWGSLWRKWVRREVKFDEERAQRANNPEATNDQRPSHSYASAGKRRARSVETEILMRDILDRPPST